MKRHTSGDLEPFKRQKPLEPFKRQNTLDLTNADDFSSLMNQLPTETIEHIYSFLHTSVMEILLPSVPRMHRFIPIILKNCTGIEWTLMEGGWYTCSRLSFFYSLFYHPVLQLCGYNLFKKPNEERLCDVYHTGSVSLEQLVEAVRLGCVSLRLKHFSESFPVSVISCGGSSYSHGDAIHSSKVTMTWDLYSKALPREEVMRVEGCSLFKYIKKHPFTLYAFVNLMQLRQGNLTFIHTPLPGAADPKLFFQVVTLPKVIGSVSGSVKEEVLYLYIATSGSVHAGELDIRTIQCISRVQGTPYQERISKDRIWNQLLLYGRSKCITFTFYYLGKRCTVGLPSSLFE